MNILDKIVASTRLRVERDKAAQPIGDLLIQPAAEPFRFERSLRQPGIGFICEVKRASPSKGLIAPDFPYLEIAKDYEAAGAAAISVLTEPEFFQGSPDYLKEIAAAVATPVLRKDFVVDEYQVRQARLLGADAILLICAVLAPEALRRMLVLADSLELSCLVEAHDEAEVKTALDAGARVIGVNNRDLKTFEVDLGTSLRLRELVPPEVLFVSESGISGPEEVERLRANGVDAVLVGESLMRAPDKAAALQLLRGAGQNQGGPGA